MIGLPQLVSAQERTVTGKVMAADDGAALPGVNVVIKGTRRGTTTDAAGAYSLSAPGDATLIFSFIGLQTQEVAVGSRNVVDVKLVNDAKQLSEIVVTAIGITREKKALSYAVVSASGDQLAQRSEPDALRSLTGKVPGVNITSGGGSPGQGTRITIRGNNSFTGNNQPLFVVDGIPFDNSVNASTGFNQASTFSNRAYDIDPNNIESMTVLKGAAAAALYGSRAANGVVVITTKSGSKSSRKGLEVNYNASYSIEQVSSLPDYQNVYGQGSNQNYNGGFIGNWGPPFTEAVDGVNAALGFERYSKVIQPGVPEGMIRHPYTDPAVSYTNARNYRNIFPELVDVNVPYTYHDIVGGFFDMGQVLENAVNITSTGDKTSLNAGFSRMSNRGMVPNSESGRTTLNFGGNATLLNGLTFSGNVNYVNTTQQNPQSGASFYADYGSGSTGSIYDRIFYLPRNFDLNEYPFENPVDGSNIFYRALDNPLWTAKYNLYTSKVNRVFGNLTLNYNVTPWLSFTAKGGINTYGENRRSIQRKGGVAFPDGRVWTDDITFTEVDFNFLGTVSKDVGHFGFRGIVGFNPNQRATQNRFAVGTNITSTGLNKVDATADPRVYMDFNSLRRLYGVYGDLQFSYRNYAFLNFTGRNDWSSTLPKANNNYFYPSVSGTFVFTDAFNMSSNVLNFGKLRASWAKVGKDADPYRVNTVYLIGQAYNNTNVGPNPFPNASLSDRLNNANLRPEFTAEYEVGTELQFLQNRIGLDLTYFDRRSTDLIVEARLPASSGFGTQMINAGIISNKGWEIGLNLTPVKLSNGLTWNTNLAYTSIRSSILDAGPAGEFLLQGSPLTSLGTIMRKGEPYGMIFGTRNARDDQGNLLINELTGRPFVQSESQLLGDPNPDFTLGINNTISFKNFTFGALFDWRQGGKMFSVTAASLLLRGQLKTSEDREALRVVPGVYGDPSTFEPILDDNGQPVRNTTPITAFDSHFSDGFGAYGADETNVYDITTIRLREATLGYTFPKAFLEKYTKVFGSFRIMLSGRNLWFSSPNLLKGLNFDPEVLSSFPDSNLQGFDLGAAPSSRRYGINLSATF